MPEKSWKAFERRIARACNGKRIPVTGERDGADVEHELFCYQAKLRKAIPKSIREWSDSIHRTAQRANKIGVLVIKEPGKHDDNALVILRYRDWVDLHGTVPQPSQTTGEAEG